MSNPFLPSISTILHSDSIQWKDENHLFSITDSIMQFLMDETKVLTELLHEWIKLSALLTRQPVTEGYLSQWWWVNSLVSAGVNSTLNTADDNECNEDSFTSTAEINLKEQPTKEHMRILFLTWEFPPHIVGGLSRHVHGLTKHLAEKGHEIHVITAGAESLPVMEQMDGVFIHRVKPLRANEKDFLLWIAGLNIAIAEKAAALTADKSFDCVHSHDWLVGAAAISLKKNLHLPLVTTIHATEYGRNSGIYTELQRFIHNKEKQLVDQSDQVVICSDFMKAEVQKLFKAVDEKLVTIPNGIDCDSSADDKNMDYLADIQIESDRKMIFSIGRMVKEKGYDTLIEAAAVLKRKGINVSFIIAGKGPMLEVYRSKVSEMQLSDTVYFIGFIDDKKRNALLELSEMAVFPSLYEPFGIVALEAMQAGKPTLVSNTGGLKGIVQHLETGVLIEPANSVNIADQIIYLLENPDLAKKIGINGKRAVQSRFSWKAAAEETLLVYNKTLHTRKHHQ
ncbi:glycosyltransferase family 4 protein [Niallia oryzisoli]|uniref:glycosyltransferase family 4 protein n=1 Tax=Niallia oryzisoli TaxID=1737571 RepID=UPI0037361616